jgi:hypothetical protein
LRMSGRSQGSGSLIVASYFRLRFWALGLALVVFASFPYALQRT